MQKILFLLSFVIMAVDVQANIPATPREQFVAPSIRTNLSAKEREARGQLLYARAITRLKWKMYHTDDVREKAVFSTIVEQSGRVHALVSVEDRSVFFIGTYTDPASGVEGRFECLIEFLE